MISYRQAGATGLSKSHAVTFFSLGHSMKLVVHSFVCMDRREVRWLYGASARNFHSAALRKKLKGVASEKEIAQFTADALVQDVDGRHC